MKTLTLLAAGIMLAQTSGLFPARAQVYSPRRLTQRIAPQLAPAQTGQPPAQAPSPTSNVLQPPPDPVKTQADKEEAARKTAEFRKQRAREDAASQTGELESSTLQIDVPPLIIDCPNVRPDSQDSLQNITLCLSNTVPKTVINRVTMRLMYYDSHGQLRKEWTTERDLDHPLPGKSSMELSQPAYFMPLLTKRVKVEVKEVKFADGRQWVSKAN